MADFNTAKDQSAEDLDIAEEAAVVSGERASRARDVGLRETRGAVAPAIRQAEAAAAATGFAGTGAGDAARAQLAEEFMADVGDIEATRAEAAEDIDIGLEAAMLADTRAVEKAAGTYGGVETQFAETKATHDMTIETQLAGAKNALRTIQGDMTSMIIDTRTALDDKTWSPFDMPGSVLQGKETGDAAIYGEWSGEQF